MCGIAGIVYFDQKMGKKFDHFEEVLAALRHRGPDHQNYSQIPGGALFHTRLSILDVSAASDQPFVKNRNHLCFNGELFNYKELKLTLGN